MNWFSCEVAVEVEEEVEVDDDDDDEDDFNPDDVTSSEGEDEDDDGDEEGEGEDDECDEELIKSENDESEEKSNGGEANGQPVKTETDTKVEENGKAEEKQKLKVDSSGDSAHPNKDEDTGDELEEVESTESNSVVEQIQDAVKEITKPNNINKFLSTQKGLEGTEKRQVLENTTRWNSAYLMLKRAYSLRRSFTAILPDWNFYLHLVQQIVAVLQPLYEVTMKLQQKKVRIDFILYVTSLEFIRSYVLNEEIITGELEASLLGVLYSGQFSSFDNYLKWHGNDKPLDIRITALLASIPPSNSDMEKLLSFAKYLKTSIQGRMNTEVFTRNVFSKMTEGVDDMINKVTTKVVTTRPCTVVVHDIDQCYN